MLFSAVLFFDLRQKKRWGDRVMGGDNKAPAVVSPSSELDGSV